MATDIQTAAIAQSSAGTDTVVAAAAGKVIEVFGYQLTLDASGTAKFASDPQANEVNTLTVDATAGTYELTVNGQTASLVPFDANAAALQAIIEGLSNVAPGDVVVTGGPGDSGGTTPYTLTWGGLLADTNMTVTTDATLLIGGGAAATVGTTTAGEGTSTDLTGAMKIGASVPCGQVANYPLFRTAAGEGLQVTSATGKATGYAIYRVVG